MKERQAHLKQAAWIVGIALGLRGALLFSIGPDPRYAYTSDSASYYGPAQKLVNTGSYATAVEGRQGPELYRTPGYPLFLIPFLSAEGVHTRAVQWAQAILGSLSAGGLYFCALLVWKDSRAAMAAGIGMALDFTSAIHCSFILSDILFAFAVTLVLFLWAKAVETPAPAGKLYFLCGAASAWAAFVRPVWLYYVIAAAALLFASCVGGRRKGMLFGLGLYLLGSVIPISAWFVRNKVEAGQWTFSSIQGTELYFARAALVESFRTHSSFAAAAQTLEREASQASGEDVTRWSLRYLFTHKTAYLGLMGKDFLKIMMGNSVKIAAWTLLKDERYAPSASPIHPSEGMVEQVKKLALRHPFLGIMLCLYVLFLLGTYVLAAAGFVAWGRAQGWDKALLLFSPALYLGLITVVMSADAQARYRIPMMPALFLFAGGSLCRFLKGPDEQQQR